MRCATHRHLFKSLAPWKGDQRYNKGRAFLGQDICDRDELRTRAISHITRQSFSDFPDWIEFDFNGSAEIGFVILSIDFCDEWRNETVLGPADNKQQRRLMVRSTALRYGSRTRVAAVEEKRPIVVQRTFAAWIALYRTSRTHGNAYWTRVFRGCVSSQLLPDWVCITTDLRHKPHNQYKSIRPVPQVSRPRESLSPVPP